MVGYGSLQAKRCARPLFYSAGDRIRNIMRGEKGVLFMSKRLYVGNLPFDATTEDVRTAFEVHGTVQDVSLITDRETGRAKGFGFVEMDEEGAMAAIAGLNSKDFGGRDITVNEARERTNGRDRR
jgi:RNA recognition motif-containing protein